MPDDEANREFRYCTCVLTSSGVQDWFPKLSADPERLVANGTRRQKMTIATMLAAAGVALAACAGTAAADPWKDESGHGRRYGDRSYDEPRYERRSYKEEYRRGRCKIERKWDEDEYKEEIKCKRGARPVYGYYRY